jgi:hypothetical protein
MRVAFVVRLGSDTQPRHQQLEGWIEEVDTGRELRFRSTDELVAFLCQCYQLAQHRERAAQDVDPDS